MAYPTKITRYSFQQRRYIQEAIDQLEWILVLVNAGHVPDVIKKDLEQAIEKLDAIRYG